MMTPTTIAAFIFAFLASFAAIFQFALACGAPWGHLTMGGRFAGRLPMRMRFAAIIQMIVLLGLAASVLVRAHLWYPELNEASRTGVWFSVAVSFVSSLANLATPSKPERRLWAPVTLVMLATSLLVASS
jgi:hypothetical protein